MCVELYRLGRTLGLCMDNYVPLSQDTTISKHQLSCYAASQTKRTSCTRSADELLCKNHPQLNLPLLIQFCHTALFWIFEDKRSHPPAGTRVAHCEEDFRELTPHHSLKFPPETTDWSDMQNFYIKREGEVKEITAYSLIMCSWLTQWYPG